LNSFSEDIYFNINRMKNIKAEWKIKKK
jgi:hypothetical protein